MNEKVKNAFDTMCDAISQYRITVTNQLKENGKEMPLENGYSEDEPLVINAIDDKCEAITYELDKARYNEKHGYVEFHAVSVNYNESDEWIPYYYLGSEDLYAMENIIWED